MASFLECFSPNYDMRPLGCVIDLIVIHYTDMFGIKDVINLFSSAESNVSAHYIIDENGDIYSCVNPLNRAWHAGVSFWRGRIDVNDFSIGIELHNPGHQHFLRFKYWKEYPECQMESLCLLLEQLCKRFSISRQNIVGHSDIAPWRKIDPGPHFRWSLLSAKGFSKAIPLPCV
ncbi:MAG: N-acetylmuramoyl-L-alanine amidase [Alphaproteobacteria bacterium]